MFKIRISEFVDKAALLLAMAVFLAVGLSSIRSIGQLDRLSKGGVTVIPENRVDIQPLKIEPLEIDSSTWILPSSQSRGENWVFDVFTPPVLYYNPESREFSVSPPELVAETVNDPWKEFGVELVEVRQRPYRLQLVGYAADGKDYLAYFEYIPTGELLLAREGKSLVEAGVKVISFEVKRVEIEQEGNTRVYENLGVARLMDYESGEEIFLTNMETKMFSDLEAQFKSLDKGDIFVVREGGHIELPSGSYIVSNLSENPQEAVVTKHSSDGGRRFSKLLKPGSRRSDRTLGDGADSETSPFAIRPKIIPPKPSS